MTRMRLRKSTGMGSDLLLEQQRQGKGGAFTQAVAAYFDAASQFLGGERGGMEAKPVAIFFGRKAVAEDPGEILRIDADAIVDHFNAERFFAGAHAQDDLAMAAERAVDGVL